MSVPHPRAYHEAFAARVRHTPDRLAVVGGPQAWTYGELQGHASRIARRLRSAGVGPERLVGILLDRTVDWMAAVLGVLESGAAYVPLDAAWPAARVRTILREAGVAAVIARAPFDGWLDDPREYGAHLDIASCLTHEPDGLGDATASRARPRCDPATLAYVIYTSGSTGRPKGVMVEHRALTNLIAALRATVYRGLGHAPLRIAVNGPLTFDTSIKQIVQLALGHTLYIVPEPARLDPRELAAFCAASAIDVLDGTPTQVSHWLSADLFAGRAPAPRIVLVGGEAIGPSLWEQMCSRPAGSGPSFYNLYGPTECCVDTLISPITPRQPSPRLGSPIRGARVHLLAPDMQPVEVGMSGELYIGGAGVARGYLRQPRLTAERFVPDPAGASGARLYRTGDLAQPLSGGGLAYVGRVDHQIKLRGFRIEPGEIEAALRRHPVVEHAVVLLREDRPGEPRLVAYLSAREILTTEAQRTATRAVRERLSEELPDYMVPGAIVWMAAWPRTENGKLDRRALPPPEADDGGPRLEPRTPIEEVMAAIWCDVLGLTHVGPHDDFFERGGHSLLIAQVAARVRQALRCELPLAALFDHPTVAGMAGLVDAASGDAAEASMASIARVARQEHHPVSFAQERVWFLQRLAAANVAYVFRTTVHFNGAFDHAALERALSAIVSRHEMLRTTFVEIDGRPRQRVHPARAVTLPIVDLSAALDAPGAFEALLAAECRTGFDLSALPLVRWTLVRVAANAHVLIHVEHHLVHDGWSFNIFLAELRELYAACAAGRPSTLPELPIQFVDFCEAQRAWLHSPDAARQIQYWMRALDDAPPALGLPLDRPRPALQTFAGAIVRRELPAALAEGLRAIGRREHATLFMTMMAAFTTLLGQWSGQTDICVGSAVANRRSRETEPLIGMIVNNVVIRARLDGDPAFAALLRQVRATTLDAYTHQDAPFDAVVQALRITPQVSHNPLFQVAFSFHDAPLCDLQLPGLELAVTDLIDNGSAKFDMNVVVIPRREQRVTHRTASAAEGITLIWEYNTDLFEPETARRIVDRYVRLLEAVAAGPERRLSDLTAIDETEQGQLDAWNETSASIPRGGLLRSFAAMVRGTPGATAVVTRDEHLTYGELDRQSSRLARFLVTGGWSAGAVIGVRLRRSARLLATLLGVLKAGGAFLPLDPDLPPQRLATVLDDSRARLLLTDSSFARPSDITTPVIDVEHDWPRVEQFDDIAPARSIHPGDPAYLIYTSGSTGRPKGVVISHGALANALAALRSVIRPTRRDRMFAVTSVGFDIAMLELFLPLVTGASCWIASGTIRGGVTVLDELAASGATLLQATPAGWRALLDQGWAGSPTLKALSGGEPLPVSLARELLSRSGSLWNLYGPTETTVYSTTHRVGPREAAMSIGRPIANTQTFVLDRLLRPVPVGAIGELVIGGAGVALGYWRRPAATAAAFVPNPYARVPGSRMYRTGDLVRQRRDGTLDCLGRRDHQLKVRGYRIEPGEIEAALRDQPGVREAVVVARDEGRDGPRLVAYVVPEAPVAMEERSARAAELRALLKARLPDYMVPRAMVWVTEWPLTIGGKLQRAALPPPEPEAARVSVAPRTPIEATLAAIWREVLGCGPIGVHDHFFDLGGHSLTALQIVSRAWRELGVDVPLHVVFDSPTIAELAATIERSLPAPAATLAS